MGDDVKKTFMKIFSVDEKTKIKRSDLLKEYRISNREETLAKKRKEKLSFNINKNSDHYQENAILDFDLLQLRNFLVSSNYSEKLKSTIKIRRLLSVQKNPPISEIIKADLLPIFINFLKNDSEPQLQFEAAWVITNITSGTSEQTISVVKEGAVLPLIKLLSSPKDNLKEQSIWALGNIAGDSHSSRDFLLDVGILEPFLDQMNSPNRTSFLRNSAWTLSNLCRGKPGPKTSYIKRILPTLQKFIFSEDTGILADVCWAFSYISDGSTERIQDIIDNGVVQRTVELLMHSETIIQSPALRVVGNIAAGNDLQTQTIINCGGLPCLLTLINSFHKSIKKEACWTLSNITAGSVEQIQAVIDAKIIPTLIYILKYSEIDVKKEAAWAISNATTSGLKTQIDYLVKQDCIQPMVDLLDSSDARIVTVMLDGLENILEMGNQTTTRDFPNEYVHLIEQAGGLEKLENLQYHSNKSIYERIIRLLEKFFSAEDDLFRTYSKNEKNSNLISDERQIPECLFGFSKK